MKTSITFACALFTAGTVLAQNYYMAEQQAKRVSGKNDAEQQRIANAASDPASAAAHAAAAAPAAPMDPALQATLNNIDVPRPPVEAIPLLPPWPPMKTNLRPSGVQRAPRDVQGV